ncbi:MAG: hypothetical protein PVF33_02535 [Candidatus Latescibacterota bacterium]|jgi:hypothetical protein
MTQEVSLGWCARLTPLSRRDTVLKYQFRYDSAFKNNTNRELILAKVELNTQAIPFVLDDFNGNLVSLSDFVGRKNVLVVLNRGFS